MSTITVDWPDGGHLSETMWRRRLADLADRAESQLTNHDATLQERATLAVQWLGLCWSGFSAATIAASARGSLLVGENIVVAPAPADQIAERLAMLWRQADADAVAVEVPMPLLERGPVPDHVPGTRRPRAKVPAKEPEAPLEPAVEVLAALEPADLSDLSEAEFRDLCPQGFHGVDELEVKPADLGVEAQLEHGVEEALAPAVEEVQLEPAAPAPADEDPDELPAAWLEPPAAAPAPPAEPAPAPPEPVEQAAQVPTDTSGWFTPSEAAELLGCAVTTLGRWRSIGDLGQEGIDWVADGRSFRHRPEVLEQLLDRPAASRMSTPSTRRRRRHPCIADRRPDGWLTPDEAAAAAGVSSSLVRKALRAGLVPEHLTFRASYRNQWIDPAALQFLAKKIPPGLVTGREG
jgi:hypothetical protein